MVNQTAHLVVASEQEVGVFYLLYHTLPNVPAVTQYCHGRHKALNTWAFVGHLTLKLQQLKTLKYKGLFFYVSVCACLCFHMYMDTYKCICILVCVPDSLRIDQLSSRPPRISLSPHIEVLDGLNSALIDVQQMFYQLSHLLGL